ncbi:reverse transcriptase domain-containing protein [Tanacetum coccineum]
MYGLRSERFDIQLCVELKYFKDCCFKTSMDLCVGIWLYCGDYLMCSCWDFTQGNGGIDGQGGQVGSQGNEGDVRNVIVNNNRRGCTYKEFLACNPKEYDGKGGAIVCTHWIEKMESVQDMSGREAAVGMSWEDFKTLTRHKFFPINEMQKLETEFWNHTMAGASHAAYTDRFHELARLVPHLVTPENKRIERYIYGRAPQILGMVAATEPVTIQRAVQKGGTLTDEAVRNGSLKKNPEKRGNSEEPNRDRNA